MKALHIIQYTARGTKNTDEHTHAKESNGILYIVQPNYFNFKIENVVTSNYSIDLRNGLHCFLLNS